MFYYIGGLKSGVVTKYKEHNVYQIAIPYFMAITTLLEIKKQNHDNLTF